MATSTAAPEPGPMETGSSAVAPRDARGRLLGVARAVAWRSLKTFYSNPALFMPSLLFPLMFFVAFTGGLSKIGDLPGFDYPKGYATFQWCFTFLQSSGFAGAFLGFGVARDFDTKFMRRIMLAASDRRGILLGYSFAGIVRCLVTMTWITTIGFVGGVKLPAPGDFAIAAAMALVVNQLAVLWGVGVAMRIRSSQAGPAIQMPLMLAFFLAPVYVPLALLGGWLKSAAKVNPITYVLTAVRDVFLGRLHSVDTAVVASLAFAVVLTVWAIRSLRSAELSGA